MEILASGSRGPRKATLPTYRELEKDEFVIGDEDDEAELEDEAVVTYEDEGKDGLPSYGGEAEGRPHDAIAEKQALAQPSLHYLKPTETLLGLSLQYNVPVSIHASFRRAFDLMNPFRREPLSAT